MIGTLPTASRGTPRPAAIPRTVKPTRAIELAYAVRRRRGDEVFREGYRVDNVVASYVHAHWASNPTVADAFVTACASR